MTNTVSDNVHLEFIRPKLQKGQSSNISLKLLQVLLVTIQKSVASFKYPSPRTELINVFIH